MGFNWDAFVVRAADDAALAKVKEVDPRAIALPGGFARLKWDSSPDWSQSGTTNPWSKRFGEAWMFVAASASGVFAYEHGKDGVPLRTLSYYPDEGWTVVAGRPEEWESVLFNEHQIEHCEHAADDNPNDPRWDRELDALKAKRLVVGHFYPVAEPELTQYIAKQLGTQLIR
jgi:hypothetical protein